jgi:hypothetical protein
MAKNETTTTPYSYQWWIAQIERDEKRLRDGWHNYAKKIVKRYKDNRKDEQRRTNKLNLFWGVRGFFYDGMVSTDQTFEDVLQILREKEYIQRGETVITVASMPIAARGTTNMMKISVVE